MVHMYRRACIIIHKTKMLNAHTRSRTIQTHTIHITHCKPENCGEQSTMRSESSISPQIYKSYLLIFGNSHQLRAMCVILSSSHSLTKAAFATDLVLAFLF